MPIPRDPAEIVVVNGERKVYNSKEIDVTEEYLLGAQRTLDTARTSGAKIAIMKSNSPSCGCGKIYDGSFSGNLINGDGITATLLKENGIRVITRRRFSGVSKIIRVLSAVGRAAAFVKTSYNNNGEISERKVRNSYEK